MTKKVKLSDTIPKIKKVVETKANPGRAWRWRVAYAQYDKTEVYASLAEDLIKSKLRRPYAQYKITFRMENDVQVIRVWYSDVSRATYYIEAF